MGIYEGLEKRIGIDGFAGTDDNTMISRTAHTPPPAPVLLIGSFKPKKSI